MHEYTDLDIAEFLIGQMVSQAWLIGKVARQAQQNPSKIIKNKLLESIIALTELGLRPPQGMSDEEFTQRAGSIGSRGIHQVAAQLGVLTDTDTPPATSTG